jgi:hypothetical protein
MADQAPSALMVNLYKKKIKKLAEQMFRDLCRYRGMPTNINFKIISARQQKVYIRLAAFVIEKQVHPGLYLRIMSEFQKNMYPNLLYGELAWQKYKDYIEHLKKQYRSLERYTSNIQDRSLNILRNDLYVVQSVCAPVMDSERFWSDVRVPEEPPAFFGKASLILKMSVLKHMVDPKTLKVLEHIVNTGSIEQSGYAAEITAAIHVR